MCGGLFWFAAKTGSAKAANPGKPSDSRNLMAWSGSCKISRIAYNVSTDSGHQPMGCNEIKPMV